ncbi:MAG: hypothetical protein ABR524_12790 [Thermoanaerobaculia bacterium]
MSSTGDAQALPTMVVPQGTDIRVNPQGHLSIRTPGNLIIQNSGTYGELESTGGSIRIDANVHVEAASVRAAQGCFIQGTLTTWKLKARKIALDERACAYVMLQESEYLEMAKSARLVGNFANEQEVYLMLGKFSSQLRELPGSFDLQKQTSLGAGSAPLPPFAPLAEPAREPAPEPPAPVASPPKLSESLTQALEMLDREMKRPDLDSEDRSQIEIITRRIRSGNLEEAAETYREAFAEIHSSSESMRMAFNLIDNELRYF